MRNELVGFLSTIAIMVIFLSLNYFYKKKFKKNVIAGKQKLIGAVILIISLIAALVLMM